MRDDLRRDLIGKNLGIKPINHGQVYSFQIAIPDSKKKPIDLERRQALENSLIAQGSNLSSLVIRRTEAYDDEDIEYELIYGADWLQVAQELDIEKVWAWVFDLTDEQAIATAKEMELLSGARERGNGAGDDSDSTDPDIAALLDQKLQASVSSLKSVLTHTLKEIKDELNEKITRLNHRLDSLEEPGKPAGFEEILEKLENIRQASGSRRSPTGVKSDEPINLIEASAQDIEAALEKVGVNGPQLKAAIKAVDKWKNSGQGLTWKNIERSYNAKSTSPEKVSGFGPSTYQALWEVTSIPDDPRDQ